MAGVRQTREQGHCFNSGARLNLDRAEVKWHTLPLFLLLWRPGRGAGDGIFLQIGPGVIEPGFEAAGRIARVLSHKEQAEVQVRAVRIAGFAAFADHLARLHRILRLQEGVKLRKMGVDGIRRLPAPGVLQNDA